MLSRSGDCRSGWATSGHQGTLGNMALTRQVPSRSTDGTKPKSEDADGIAENIKSPGLHTWPFSPSPRADPSCEFGRGWLRLWRFGRHDLAERSRGGNGRTVARVRVAGRDCRTVRRTNTSVVSTKRELGHLGSQLDHQPKGAATTTTSALGPKASASPSTSSTTSTTVPASSLTAATYKAPAFTSSIKPIDAALKAEC